LIESTTLADSFAEFMLDKAHASLGVAPDAGLSMSTKDLAASLKHSYKTRLLQRGGCSQHLCSIMGSCLLLPACIGVAKVPWLWW
jgi:hypothetical protein